MTSLPRSLRWSCAAVLPLLAGCAQDAGSYPSLAPRAVEQRGFAEPEVAAPPTGSPTADPALTAPIAAARAKLERAAASYASTLSRLAPLVTRARGAAVGSDAWIAAQSALADLDAIRSDTRAAQNDLEALAIDRAQSGAPDDPALSMARADAEAQLVEEETQGKALEAKLASA